MRLHNLRLGKRADTECGWDQRAMLAGVPVSGAPRRRKYAMRLPLSVYAGLAVTVLSFASNAHAATITYEISGVASGTIGATTFTNALVQLIGTGNTANITSLSGGEAFANPFSGFTVTIAGVGTASVTDPSGIWAIPTALSGPNFFSVPAVVIGRIDSPPNLDSFTGLGAVGSNALAGYEGATGMGPITDEGGIGFPACGGPTQDPCVHTTLGLLSFSANLSPTNITTQGTFVATLTPEPASYGLILCGLGLLAVIRRRQTATTAAWPRFFR